MISCAISLIFCCFPFLCAPLYPVTKFGVGTQKWKFCSRDLPGNNTVPTYPTVHTDGDVIGNICLCAYKGTVPVGKVQTKNIGKNNAICCLSISDPQTSKFDPYATERTVRYQAF